MARKFRAIQSTKTKKPKNQNINHLSLFVLLYVKVSYLLNNLSNLKTKPIKSYIYFPSFLFLVCRPRPLFRANISGRADSKFMCFL